LSALVSANNTGQNTALPVGHISDRRHTAGAEAVAGLAASGLLSGVVELGVADGLALRRVGLAARQGADRESVLVLLVQKAQETELRAALRQGCQQDVGIANLKNC
jgi:hypothetical protein